MVEAFKRSEICSVLCFLGLFFTSVFVQAQDQKTILDIEKIYLHTDRSTYFVGEDLWYKAYNVRASNNLLFDNSNVLYVELIAPDSKIIARNKTNLEIGLGHGDFQLQDSLDVKPGKYQIRAYTNWNRNFGDDFVFKKDIEVIDVFESNANTKTNQTKVAENKTTKRATPIQNTFRVDFFPEGGSLLENVASVVGFKAIDSNGKPINVKGEIFNSDDELVTFFSSSHDGMGKFQFLPNEGKNYYAKIKTQAGAELRQDLPKVAKQGYLLSYRTLKGRKITSIITNEATLSQNPNAALTVVCKAKGISYLESTQTVTKTTLSFELAKDNAPEGISQITLYDSDSRPQSERLVYIDKEQDLEVQVLVDKESYKPNEKATINVSSKSSSDQAKSASFSMSVTDSNGVEDKDYGTTISSYFLMESDIRGKVHNPSYYFDATNPKRLEHLDNLLLTQGWRDFLWKTMPKVDEKNPYKAEKGITISGRVKQLLGEKPLIGNNLTLALMSKKNHGFFNATTDSLGRFQFENLLFSGKTNMFLNSRNEKGKFRGEIILDAIEQDPINVSFINEPINRNDTIQAMVENVYQKYRAFGVQPENVLEEVEIISAKKKQTFSLHGIPDYSYVVDENSPVTNSIYDFIQYAIPGVIVNGDSVRFMRYNEPVHFILNGFPVYNQSDIDILQPMDIEKIDALKGATASIYGSDGANGVIAIYTKEITGKRPDKELFHTIGKEIDGFYTARVFYSPTPEQVQFEVDKKSAVRNTIYWNPYVHPDKTGNASVDYFNSSVETKVKVALEGITASGIPVVKTAYYTIKK